MEQKTNVDAKAGRQDIIVTREFELPVDLLFKAFTEAELVAQWMGTHVVKLECRKHGSYEFITSDPKGNKFGFNGTIHEVIPNKRITRTFEMENTAFPVQLEFLEFEALGQAVSQLTMRIIYKSVEDRDNMLKLPFKYGINAAHNRLQEVMEPLK